MNWLRQLRVDAGLTQTDLSVAAGVAKSVIGRIEQGKSAHPENLKRLADYFSAEDRRVFASELRGEAPERSTA